MGLKLNKERFEFAEVCVILKLDEKDRVLGYEPVTKFLPSDQLKSRNNLVQRDRIYKTDVNWQFQQGGICYGILFRM